MKEIRMFRGDVTKRITLPMDFQNCYGDVTGKIVATRFDGKYTVGIVELNADEPVNPIIVFMEPEADDPMTLLARWLRLIRDPASEDVNLLERETADMLGEPLEEATREP